MIIIIITIMMIPVMLFIKMAVVAIKVDTMKFKKKIFLNYARSPFVIGMKKKKMMADGSRRIMQRAYVKKKKRFTFKYGRR